MNTFNILILSIVQGVTELLPISSSAHLILTDRLLDFELYIDSFFLSVLHIGTTLAIIIFYRKILFKNFFTKDKWVFFLKLFLASIPAGLAGFLLENYISSEFYTTKIIAISLIIVGLLFVIIENVKIENSEIKPEKIPLWKMFLIGLVQMFALIPGTSRSGVTTLTGMLIGLDKYSAFNFSFILGIPILLGSIIYEIIGEIYLMYKINTHPTNLEGYVAPPILEMLPFIIPTFIVGYISLIIVKKFKKKKWLTVFGIYRIVIGILILLLAI